MELIKCMNLVEQYQWWAQLIICVEFCMLFPRLCSDQIQKTLVITEETAYITTSTGEEQRKKKKEKLQKWVLGFFTTSYELADKYIG